MRTRNFALPTAAALLMLTACGGGEGLGNSEALNDVELHIRDDDQPEVVLHSPVESDEGASLVLDSGDGEQVDGDNIVEFHQVAASPESGDVLGHNFDQALPQLSWMPSLQETGQDIDSFFHDALTAEGVTIGSDVAIYYPADDEGLHDQQLAVFRLVDQYPVYAEGEVQEQSGDLPEIDNEVGAAPELVDHDGSAEAPTELSEEVLIEGDGAEVAEEDQLFVQYRGWSWSDGEEFDGSWPEEGEAELPANFSLQSVVEGWTEGISGHHVGDRVLLVIPPEQAYGGNEGHELEEETLIFVIDIVQAISPDDMPEPEQPQQPQLPEDMSEEELEELMEQMEQQQGGGEAPEDQDAPEGEDAPEDDTEEDGSE